MTRRGRFELAPGTRVLLTTDGVPEAIRNVPTLGARQIRAALDGGGDRPLDALVRTALDCGGEDNIAAVLITVGGEGCAGVSKPPREARWATVWRALRRGQRDGG